jgi:hypothetical protein
MAIALAQSEAAFGEGAAARSFKLRVTQLLRLGPRHEAIRARFGVRAAMLSSRNLDTAIAATDRWWRDERKAFQIACVLGSGSRLSLEILSELRLILRFMRFMHMETQFGAAVATLCDQPFVMAAE